MKWLSALILTAVAAMGCRSSQPATNPFLRTTVPPPATGAVVVQGEPYVPQGAPQVMQSTPAPVAPIAPTYSPPPTSQFVPAAPPPAAVSPPIVAPMAQPPVMAPPPAAPMMAPPKDKYSPPGGSFQYNQSSVQPPNSGVVTAVYTPPGSQRLREAIAARTATATAPVTAPAGTNTPATAEIKPMADAAAAVAVAPAPKSNPVAAPVLRGTPGKPGSAIRIAGGTPRAAANTADDAAAGAAGAVNQPAIDPEAARVIDEVNRQQRQAAGKAAFKEVSRTATGRATAQLAIITPDTVSDTTESFSAGAQ